MRLTTGVALCAAALLTFGVRATLGAEEEGTAFASGVLDEVELGSVWTYRVTIPKGNVIGSQGEGGGFPAGAPRWPDDCMTKLVRFAVTEVKSEDGGTVVRLRVEDESLPPLLAAMGACEVELRDAEGSPGATVRRGDVQECSMRADCGRVPIVGYPCLRALPELPGMKALVPHRGSGILHGFQASQVPGGESLIVEAREYRQRLGRPSGTTGRSWRWTEFYDAEANEIVLQPREDRELLTVALEAYEIQEWCLGEPLPRQISRYTADGILIMSCKLISGPDGPASDPRPEEAAPAAE